MARTPLATGAAAAAAILLAGLLGGCEGDAPPRDAVPTPTTTPLAEMATDTVTVARDAFCDRVAPAAVEAALGGPADDADAWSNGERARLAPGLTDVAHEYGCVWSAGASAARAWVFAPPVTAAQAERLRRESATARGCEALRDAPGFGTHDVAVRCGDATTGAVAFHGLFGDAWLSCSVQAVGADLPTRAEEWCVTVLQAATAG